MRAAVLLDEAAEGVNLRTDGNARNVVACHRNVAFSDQVRAFES